jgi:hypothetical protein
LTSPLPGDFGPIWWGIPAVLWIVFSLGLFFYLMHWMDAGVGNTGAGNKVKWLGILMMVITAPIILGVILFAELEVLWQQLVGWFSGVCAGGMVLGAGAGGAFLRLWRCSWRREAINRSETR